MLILGTRGVTYRKALGKFFCPVCQAEMPYMQKRVRRFFTLYFIPVVPMDKLGEYVECAKCHGTFQLDVLNVDPGADAAAFHSLYEMAVLRVMVEMMLADGVIDDSEKQSIAEIYTSVIGRDITPEEIDAEIDDVQTHGLGIVEALAEMAPGLNDNGKELVIKAAFLVAAADGEFQDEEKHLLTEIAKAMNMTPAHCMGVVQSMMKQPA